MINISKFIYAGLDTVNQKYELSEAIIIPDGESSNEIQKLKKLKKECSTISKYENIPLPGFTLYKRDKKTWTTSESTWLIIDPRGFFIRVNSENLELIMHCTGITEGLVQEKCVWARDNESTKMILVPISSEMYEEANQNTNLIETKVDIKDIQIGDTVFLQNKMTGMYCGKLSFYGSLELSRKHSKYTYKPSVFLRKQVVELYPSKYNIHNDLKILKIDKKCDSPHSREEVTQHIKDTMNKTRPTFGSYLYDTRIRHVSTYSVSDVSMTYEEIDKTEAIDLFNKGFLASDIGLLLLEDKNGDKFLPDYPYGVNIGPVGINRFGLIKLISNKLEDNVYGIEVKDIKRWFWRDENMNGNIDNFTKFYKIVKHVKNETYI